MFFIGIFGIESKSKVLKTNLTIKCPFCNDDNGTEVIKSYRYFHAFFIPLWRWDIKYFIKTQCCRKLCSLVQEIGCKIENGEDVTIENKHFNCNDYEKNCPNCTSILDYNFRYCPYCGNDVK